MVKKLLLLSLFVSVSAWSFAQKCDCETEFTYIKQFMETNYAGFKDKETLMTKAGYDKLANDYLQYSKGPHSRETCLLIISEFLDHFKDDHVSVRMNFDATKIDTSFTNQKQIITISDQKYQELLHSTTFEGIYDFHDSTAYRIAVIKDKTPLHDYVGVIVSSRLPGWKKGMIKFEAKLVTDSLAKGVLYMLNQMPKVEGFFFGKDAVWGDWHRVGTMPERSAYHYVPVASKKLSDKTLYIKISSFSPSNRKNIDSIFVANNDALKSMPYLVLDLRDNGGGSDFSFLPVLPYIYTKPFQTIGNDVFATEANIAGWKQELNDTDLTAGNRKAIENTVRAMEQNKGKLVSNSNDGTDSSYTPLHYPLKVAVLINKGCASTTEEFLLIARQSSKVILMGQNTSGTLDYSNWRVKPFYCMPYELHYSTTRSRRLDVNQGIDNTGIKPGRYLAPGSDWVKAAVSELEK